MMGKLRTNIRISSDDWEQDIRHIEIEIPNDHEYKAGDIAVLYPQNVVEDLNDLLTNLSLVPSLIVRVLKKNDEHVRIFGPCSVRDLFTRYLGRKTTSSIILRCI